MDPENWAQPLTDEIELRKILLQYGLSEYEERLIENGFDTWDTVMAITEADMGELNFKLGHRRKLQRAIHEHSSSATSKEDSHNASHAQPSRAHSLVGSQHIDQLQSPLSPTRTKRSYRRRPQPDDNAPRRPNTAYVLFANHVRNNEAPSGLSFTELAKETGRRWAELSPEEREDVWEKPAAKLMQEYRNELERYKKTESYQTHQEYLEEFKTSGKRHKQESTALSDDQAPSRSESGYLDYSPASQSQTTSQSVLARELNKEDPSSPRPCNTENSPQQIGMPTDHGMREVNLLFNSLDANHELTRVDAYPLEDITTVAVKAFLRGTGSLLYLWNENEALDLIKSVYRLDSPSSPFDATEVFAMAAVGSYCDGEAIVIPFQTKFIHYFIYMLSTHQGMSELRRMRLFTCLAICRFIDNIESARILICKWIPVVLFHIQPLELTANEVSALQIGRKNFSSPSSVTELPPEKARYWWNIFRSVLFLERFAHSPKKNPI
jgi:hypothetical protein